MTISDIHTTMSSFEAALTRSKHAAVDFSPQKSLHSDNPLSLLLKAVSQRSSSLEDDGAMSDCDSDEPESSVENVSKLSIGQKSLLQLEIARAKKSKGKNSPNATRPLRKSTLKALRSVIADQAIGGGTGNRVKSERRVSLLSSIYQARALLDQNLEEANKRRYSASSEHSVEALHVPSRHSSADVSIAAFQPDMEELNAEVERMLARHSERRRQVRLQEYQIMEEARRQQEEAVRTSALVAAMEAAAARDVAVMEAAAARDAAVMEAAVARDAIMEQLAHARQSAQFQNSVEHMIMRHIARRKIPLSSVLPQHI